MCYVLHMGLCWHCLLSSIAEGKVVKLTQTSIHVIVLGFSSAIISDEDIREEFNYKIVSCSSSSLFKVHILYEDLNADLIIWYAYFVLETWWWTIW